jgi:hypothetical protein
MASCNTLGRLPIVADPECSHRFKRAVGPIQRYEWRLQAVRVQDEATVKPTNDGGGRDKQQPVESAAFMDRRDTVFSHCIKPQPTTYVVGFSLIALPCRHNMSTYQPLTSVQV